MISAKAAMALSLEHKLPEEAAFLAEISKAIHSACLASETKCELKSDVASDKVDYLLRTNGYSVHRDILHGDGNYMMPKVYTGPTYCYRIEWSNPDELDGV